jgi:hypothetical protein
MGWRAMEAQAGAGAELPPPTVATDSGSSSNQRRWLIVGAVVAGILLLCCCAFVTVPLFATRQVLPRAIRHGLSTEVARQLPATPGRGVAPGDYQITEQELQERLRGSADSSNVDRIVVHLTPAGMAIGLDSRGRSFSYTGLPVAENGQLVMRDMRVDNRVLGFFLTPGALGNAIEDAVNTYLSDNGLRLDAIQLGNGVMTLTAAAK